METAWSGLPTARTTRQTAFGWRGKLRGAEIRVVHDHRTAMISWDQMQHMAKASGTVNLTAKTFQMTAKEVGGRGRTANITGNVTSDGWLVANISGPNVNCRQVEVRWFVPSAGGGSG